MTRATVTFGGSSPLLQLKTIAAIAAEVSTLGSLHQDAVGIRADVGTNQRGAESKTAFVSHEQLDRVKDELAVSDAEKWKTRVENITDYVNLKTHWHELVYHGRDKALFRPYDSEVKEFGPLMQAPKVLTNEAVVVTPQLLENAQWVASKERAEKIQGVPADTAKKNPSYYYIELLQPNVDTKTHEAPKGRKVDVEKQESADDEPLMVEIRGQISVEMPNSRGVGAQQVTKSLTVREEHPMVVAPVSVKDVLYTIVSNAIDENFHLKAETDAAIAKAVKEAKEKAKH